MITITKIEQAADIIRPYAVKTALLTSDLLNEKLGFRLWLKAEPQQRTGSFKFRGACYAVMTLDDPDQPVLAYSSGNHAQAVALATRLSGRDATIVMPEDAPSAKIEATRAYGAEVVLYDRQSESREEIGAELAKRNGADVIAPFDDWRTITGQGTTGLEMAQQMQAHGLTPDKAVICCGGGGLMAGSTIALKHHFPDITVFAAEPEHYDDTKRSLVAGSRLRNQTRQHSICDAIVTPTPGTLTFPILQAHHARGISASDEAVLAAMHTGLRAFKVMIEPGGAIALACALSPAFQEEAQGQEVLVTASGGNLDSPMLARALKTTPMI